MKIMRETTDWSGGLYNHVYVFNDSMSLALAYVPLGTGPVVKFAHPLRIDRRGRTFEPLEDDQPTPPQPSVKTVEGSGGKTYYLTKADGYWQCSCPGYQFRGQCRHADAENQLTLAL